MKGGYRKPETVPGTCSACKYFNRFVREGRPIGSGCCMQKPWVWQINQRFPACRTFYRPREAEGSDGA
jgi:hypothetical protein